VFVLHLQKLFSSALLSFRLESCHHYFSPLVSIESVRGRLVLVLVFTTPSITMDEHSGGEGEDDPPNGEVANVLVPAANDFNQSEFEFFIDQLFNGNYGQSRTALECLV
jgi:hypothetical protein